VRCAFRGLDTVLDTFAPDVILVHGDTERRTPRRRALPRSTGASRLGHVEAGLRTGNLRSPWPRGDEPPNDRCDRRPVLRADGGRAAAATLLARRAPILRPALGAYGRNTVIDALLQVVERLAFR